MPHYKIVIRDWNEPRAWVAVVEAHAADAINVSYDGGRLVVSIVSDYFDSGNRDEGDSSDFSYPHLIGCQFSVNINATGDALYEPQWIDKNDL